MINVSDKFKEKMADTTLFSQHAEVTFANGKTITLGADEFVVGDNYFTDGAGMNSIPLGEAVCRGITMTIDNDDDWLEPYDWTYAKIRLWLEFVLETDSEESAILGEMVLGKAVLGSDGATLVEKIELGTFTCLEPETYGETVTVDAVDDMYKADVDYESHIAFPATLEAMFLDICSQCDIPFQTLEFQNHSFQVQSLPEGDYTCRQMLGYIAMIACGNCRISRNGFCEIITYDFTQEKHDLGYFISLTIGQGDITITGIQTTIEEQDSEGHTTETPVIYGEEGYMLSIENPLIATQEAVALPMIGQFIVGQTFRKFSGNHTAYPLAEFMDLCTFADWKGNTYTSFITDITFNFYGQTYFENSAEDGLRMQSKYSNSGTRAIIKAQQYIRTEANARLAMQEAFEKMIANASGMYLTEEEQPDGSIIYYLHDKPSLEESTNIIKITSEGIGFSPDGGETYPYGMTITGDMVMQIIAAEGILADWVQVGSTSLSDELSTIQYWFNVVEGQMVSCQSQIYNLGDTVSAQYSYILQTIDAINVSVGEKVSTGDMVTYVGSEIEVLKDSISLTVTGELGNTAGIQIAVGDKALDGSIDMTKVREAFANDDSSIVIAAGTILFESGTLVIDSDYFKVSDTGVVTATSGTIGGWTLSSTRIYKQSGLYEAGIYAPATISSTTNAFYVRTRTSSSSSNWSYPFYVTYGGLVHAENAEVTGTFTTESGNYKAVLTSGTLEYYYSDTFIGYFGASYWLNADTGRSYTNIRGIAMYGDSGDNALQFIAFGRMEESSSYYGSAYYISYNATVSSYRHNFYGDAYMDATLDIAGDIRIATLGKGILFNKSSSGTSYINGLLANDSYMYLGDNDYATYIRGSSLTINPNTVMQGPLTLRSYQYLTYDYSIRSYLNNSTSSYANLLRLSYYTVDSVAYDNSVLVGDSSYPLYLTGKTLFISSSCVVTSPITFDSTHGIRGTTYSGSVVYILYLYGSSSGNYVYVGDTSYATYIRGSEICVRGGNLVIGTTSDTAERNINIINSTGRLLVAVNPNNNYMGLYNYTAGNWFCYSTTSGVTYLGGSEIYANANLIVGSSSDTAERRVNIINSTGQLIVAVNPSNNYMGLYNSTASCWFCFSSTGGATYLGNTSYYTYLRGYYIYVDGTIASEVSISGRLYMYSSIVLSNNTAVMSYGNENPNTRYYLITMSDSDNVVVGTASYNLYLRGKGIYLYGTTTEVTSDARLKTDMEPITDTTILDNLQPLTYRLIANPDRVHMGFTVQDVEAALSLAGIDPKTYGITSWGIDEETKSEVGFLAYDEIIPLLVLGYQKMKAELESLKGAQ